jgi:hypothetical protein
MIDVFWKNLAGGNIRDGSNGSKQNFHKWYRIYLPHSRLRRLMGSRIGKGPVFDSFSMRQFFVDDLGALSLASSLKRFWESRIPAG